MVESGGCNQCPGPPQKSEAAQAQPAVRAGQSLRALQWLRLWLPPVALLAAAAVNLGSAAAAAAACSPAEAEAEAGVAAVAAVAVAAAVAAVVEGR